MKPMVIMSRKMANYLLAHDCKLNEIVPHYNDGSKLVFYFEHTDTIEKHMKTYIERLNQEKHNNGQNTETLQKRLYTTSE